MPEMVGSRSRVVVELVPSPDITIQRKEIIIKQRQGVVPRTKLQRSNRYVELSNRLHVFRGIPPRENMVPKAEISVEMALRGHYRGKLYHQDIDLVESRPPPVFEKRMRELAGLLSAEGEMLVLADLPRFLNRSLELFTQPILRPLLLMTFQWCMFCAWWCIGCAWRFSPSNIPYMVDEMRIASHPSALEAYILGWAVTKDSLLLEDIAAHEWSNCVHPPATMKLLAAQSGVHMAGDLRYAAIQTSALWLLPLIRFSTLS
ncbi:unnamed protein product [Lactuca saligna]|uniref:Uncharacterized protein n=1 Tax=Lactuca saligna TaxID=75948 RepID=A0AA35Z7K6_LACSI|nr:unnamed protein product [Lactuca saligna]